MKKILLKSQTVAIILVALVTSSVFFNIRPSLAVDQALSMSNVEDVAILENGDAQVTLLVNVTASPLAENYRKLLAAPSDAGVGEEMPIPENKTENGVVIPVRQEFYKSIKQEQKNSLGFATWILNSSMVPMGEQGECRVSINAYASLQVVNFTAVGSDGIWEIVVGPADENATVAAAGSAVTKIAFAQQMLESLEGDQVYEVSKIVRIKVPEGATLLNGDELAGLSWSVSFGGGTFMSASVSMDDPSTVVLNERTVVTEENITAAPTDIFEAFRGYKVFKIRYLLPESAFVGGESDLTSDSDWSCSWSWLWYASFQPQWTYAYGGATLSVTLTITPSFTLSGYLGWDFNWHGGLEWFKAWIGASASLNVKLEVTATGAISKYWETTVFDRTLYTWEFMIDWVPVWINLDLSLIPTLSVSTNGPASFSVDVDVGASFKGGVQYSDEARKGMPKGWSAIKEADAWATLTGPTITVSGTATVEPSLKIRISFMVYGVAGPYIEVQPYVTGTVTWYYPDDVTLWNVACGFRLNAGVTFRRGSWLKKLLDLSDHWFTLFDWTINSWSGRWGRFPSSITCYLDYDQIGLGSGTWVRGAIYYAGAFSITSSKSGTVYIQYSSDGVTWSTARSTQSSSTGEYSVWWVPLSNGTFLVRSYWDGNDYYKNATSQPPYAALEVSLFAKGQLEYGLDTGTMASMGSTPEPYGIAVRYTTPIKNWALQKIKVFGNYIYGDGILEVEIWDSNLTTLFSASYKYSDYFEYGGPGDWGKPIEFSDPVIISGDYYVCLFPHNAWHEHELYTGTSLGTATGGPTYSAFALRNPNRIGWLGPEWPYQIMIRAIGRSVVSDDAMYRGTDTWIDYTPTTTFYIDDPYAYSWVQFGVLRTGLNSLESRWYAPDGYKYYWLLQTRPGGSDVLPFLASVPIEANRAFYEKYLGGTFKVEIYWNGILVATQTFTVIKHERPFTRFFILPGPSIRSGESVLIISEIPISGGTVSIEYSTDNVTWFTIASGTPRSGWYDCYWVPPHAGTYYLRAVWSGNPDYYGTTSDTMILTVNPAPTSLTTTLSENTITYGSTVTITASMMPALQGRSVTFQYSNDSTIWYNLGVVTTDSAGQCASSWTPPDVGTYYIRSTWYGDTDYLGANSTIETLTVKPPAPTSVEIVYGADAEVDRTPSATVEFGVRVKNLETGQYLSGTGRVEFYVTDLSHYNIIFAGSDNDTDGDGIYNFTWTANANWPTLGPQHWSAYFTGTPDYMPSLASTDFTIYYYGAALWIDPTFQAVNITSSTAYTIKFKWNRDTTETFDLSLTGLDPTWYTLSPTTITVSYKGQTEQVTLTVSPPNAPTILKDYDFTVTATSQEDPTFSVSTSATIRVEFTPTLPASPTGGLAIAIQPKTIYTSAGAKVVVNICIINNQNFDDAITIDITNTGIPTQYQANLAWFSWLRVKVFIPAGGSINITLEITVPEGTPAPGGTLNGYVFRAVATSTANLATNAKDSGIIKLQ